MDETTFHSLLHRPGTLVDVGAHDGLITIPLARLPASRVIAWLGPAIGPAAFEVGPEVREAFVAVHREAGAAFVPRAGGKYLADLYALARQRLAGAGVAEVHGGGYCTYTEADRFFSYRRAKASGRLGAFIWIDAGG